MRPYTLRPPACARIPALAKLACAASLWAEHALEGPGRRYFGFPSYPRFPPLFPTVVLPGPCGGSLWLLALPSAPWNARPLKTDSPEPNKRLHRVFLDGFEEWLSRVSCAASQPLRGSPLHYAPLRPLRGDCRCARFVILKVSAPRECR